MSRIGKMPIAVPKTVTVDVGDGTVRVKGPKGELARQFPRQISVVTDDGTLRVERSSDEPAQRSLHGLTRSLIANMVTGVTDGYTKTLEIHGVGYRAAMQGPNLNIQVGYSHPVEVIPKPGIQFEVGQETNTRTPFVRIHGIDKEAVGQQAAEIRSVRPPEPYKGKGIRYQGEQIRRKAGKSAKGGKGK